MKQIILILTSLYLLPLFGQKLVVGNLNMNVLFSGEDNMVHISYEGIAPNDLIVKISRGSLIKKIKDNIYQINIIYSVPKIKVCKIYIGSKNNNSEVWKFKIITKKSPELTFGEIQGGAIDLKHFLAQDSLKCSNEDNIRKIEFFIKKFRVLIVPKNKEITEFAINGNKINDSIKLKIAESLPGDIILFDGIRAYEKGGERLLKPLTFNLVYQNDENYKFKTIGYYRDSFGLKIYHRLLHGYDYNEYYKIKDSVWSYFQFDKMMNKYYKISSDSFYKTKLIQTTVYDTSKRIIYKITPITDSTFNYVSYYKNGKVYQQGVVVKNTYLRYYRKYKNIEETEYDRAMIWNFCLRDTPNDLFPIDKWQMYDSLGKIKAMINYKICIEYEKEIQNKSNSYLYILPIECLIYNKRKKAKSVRFVDGELEKNKCFLPQPIHLTR